VGDVEFVKVAARKLVEEIYKGLGGRRALSPATPETHGAKPARLREPISPRGTGPGLLWGRGSTSLLLIGILAPGPSPSPNC